MRRHTPSLIAIGAILCAATAAHANIIGQHHLSWWDDPMLGVMITPQGAMPPTPASIHLMDLDEWHVDQAQTTQWYNGNAVPGLPVNPFNAANRNGLIGATAPVAGAEAFLYQITNVNYGGGSGVAAPFSFTNGVGVNDLSGINISDIHGALNIALPAAGSQFMFSNNLVFGSILDMTPGSVGGLANQDWDFNSFAGPGNFEWDVQPGNGVGAFMGGGPITFGFAMPGNWFDALNDGWIHSWDGVPLQVNQANSIGGFSGPQIPTPGAPLLLALAAVATTRRRQ